MYVHLCLYIPVYMFAGNLSSCCIHLCIESIVTCSKQHNCADTAHAYVGGVNLDLHPLLRL